ncbi:MAG: hypothetical protein V4864_16060 [Pseudomonadota bacterium]
MSREFLRKHVEELRRNASETMERAALEPDNWLLQGVAKNQLDAAAEAERNLAIEEVGDSFEALEWRLVGQRLKVGEVPMALLARLADPLNKLILRAAYFARNGLDPSQGVGDDLTNELDLRLVGVAPGSARLFIRGNSNPDTTGTSALSSAVENLFDVLVATDDFTDFYERLGEIGESAAHALRDTLKALEQEECSLEVKWHSARNARQWEATFDQVVRVRSLLDGTAEPTYRQSTLRGIVTLLAVNGRVQIVDDAGKKKTIRFNPKQQGEQVGALRLGQQVQLSVTERVVVDPITDFELVRYTLNPPQGPLH